MKTTILTAFIITISIAACTKHANDIEDNTPKATIQILNPTAGTVFSSNDSISIQATAVATATIHGYDIIIRKAEDSAKLYFKHIHDHNDTLAINHKFKPDASNTALQMELVLYLDHDGHTANKKVNFRVQ